MTNSTKIQEILQNTTSGCAETFAKIDATALTCQKKVIDAFRKNKIALRHFAGTSGYGYDDVGRDTLCKVYADVFNTESAVVSPSILSGTHALTVALFGILRPGDTLLSISGDPYDTLSDVICGKGCGSLADFGVNFRKVDLLGGEFDKDAIKDNLTSDVKIVYMQRSRGYAWRSALSVKQIQDICSFVRQFSDVCIMVDNCYGEFVENIEPTDVGVDVCVGSLIKNPGGGLAPTGGYVVGKKRYVDLVANRLTAPSIGMEIGSSEGGYRLFYQGLFMAPHTVAQALKTAAAFSWALTYLGYEVLPAPGDEFHDIVCSVRFGNERKLIDFCQSVQYVSPIDSFVTPEPWEMPGYADKVIMSAGCFVQGASIELSCDSPIRPPYVAYLQGGLTFEHGLIALEKVLENLV